MKEMAVKSADHYSTSDSVFVPCHALIRSAILTQWYNIMSSRNCEFISFSRAQCDR